MEFLVNPSTANPQHVIDGFIDITVAFATIGTVRFTAALLRSSVGSRGGAEARAERCSVSPWLETKYQGA